MALGAWLSVVLAALPCFGAADQLSFLAIGNWAVPSRPSAAAAAQRTCAQGMAKVARGLDAKFVVSLGDQFDGGIAKDASDPRFNLTFESVYTGPALQVPWYVVAGDQDHRGNVTAQLAYSSVNDRWVFPSLYHSQHVASPGGSVVADVVLIDTTVLLAWQQHAKRHHLHRHHYRPPPISSSEILAKKNADIQWTWLEKRLAASTAQYLLVAGHHPVFGPCARDAMEGEMAKLRALLEKYRVTAYFAADHCQALIDEGRGPRYVISGIGASCCCDPTNAANIPSGSLKWAATLKDAVQLSAGFASMTMNSTAAYVDFHDERGQILFRSETLLPRKTP